MIILLLVGIGVGALLTSIILDYKSKYNKTLTERDLWAGRCLKAETLIDCLMEIQPDKKWVEEKRIEWEMSKDGFLNK